MQCKRSRLAYVTTATMAMIAAFGAGCSDDSQSGTDAPSGSAVHFIVVGWDSTWHVPGVDSSVAEPGLYLDGEVMGAPMPEYVSASVNGVATDWFESDRSGWSHTFDAGKRNEPRQGPKTITVATSEGTVTGTVTIPGNYGWVAGQDGDTMATSGEKSVSWFGDAQFYHVGLYAVDSTGDILQMFDTLVHATSMTIPASAVPSEAVTLSVVLRGGYNGAIPLPGSGVSGNLSGDGTGFLCADGSLIDTAGVDGMIELVMAGRARTLGKSIEHAVGVSNVDERETLMRLLCKGM